jgi:RND family efflux transporter MFP subunit
MNRCSMRRTTPPRCFTLFGLLVTTGALVGCSHPPAAAPPQPPTVTVSQPIQRNVTDYQEYTGRTAAVESVHITAQVTGYLDKINFQDGDEVKQDAVLYKIDPRTYQAALNQATANLNQAKAHRESQADVLKRDQVSPEATPKATLIQDQANFAEAEASVGSASAARDAAQLNVDFTSVKSPIAGQVGRTLITKGNLVVANQTALTTVVSLDPTYAYFDVDEPTVEQVRQLIREGKLPSAREEGKKIPVYLGLTSEKGFPHAGSVDFINNQVTGSTATLQVRGVFANPKPAVGPRVLTPGQFVRIRLPIGPAYSALLVVGAAIGTDQDLKYIYVLNDKNEVERRAVTLGTQQGGLTVVSKGLKADDRVVVNGLQHVRAGMTVKPNVVPMPDPGAEDTTQAAPDATTK